ncbi:MAG: PAS domain S-box protein [Pseudoxanthomonas sp.]
MSTQDTARIFDGAIFSPARNAIGLLVAGLVAAVLIGLSLHRHNTTEQETRFVELTDSVVDALQQRMDMYEHGLRGARGAIISAGGPRATREQFVEYSRSRDYPREFPGVRGFGYVRRVPQAEEISFTEQARADGVPEFSIRQFTPHTGDRYVILYIEPQGANSPAIGLDIASNPVRHDAAVRAARTGEAALTSPLALYEDGSPRQDFLLLIAIYRSGVPLDTPEQRMEATIGWSYAPLRIREVLQNFSEDHDDYALRIVDSEAAGTPFFESGSFAAAGKASNLKDTSDIAVYGRKWHVTVQATAPFVESLNQISPWIAGGSVVMVTLLLSGLAYAVGIGRQRSQQILAQQARLGAMLQSSSEAIVTEDAQGIITHWNPAAERTFGYFAAEAIGQPMQQLIGDGIANEALDATRTDGGTAKVSLRHKDGHRVRLLASLSPLLDRQDQRIGTSHFFHDLSRQLQAEEQFGMVVEASPNALLVLDAQGVIQLANRQAEELFGQPRAALVGAPLLDLLPRDLHAPQQEAMRELIESPDSPPVSLGADLYITRQDQSETPVEIGLSAMRSEGYAQILATITDISERKRAEYEIHELNATLEQQVVERTRQLVATSTLQRAITSHAGYAIIASDSQGSITLFNPAAEKMLGYSAAELLGKKGVDILLDPDELHERATRTGQDPDGPINFFETVVSDSTLGRSVTEEWTHIAKNGRRIPLLLTISTLRDEHENVLGFLGMGMDLTERKQREEELRQAINAAEAANRSKSDFLANMSHEIRTPMNAILGMLYLLDRGELSPPVREMTRKIDISARALLSIINDVLDFSKIESGRIDLENTAFDLGELLENIATLMSSAVSAKPVEMVVEAPPEGARWLLGDALRLSQVLINLVGNAIKFTDRGEIVLSVRKFRSEAPGKVKLLFSIRDTGIGIPKEKQDLIFSPFHQADASTTRRFGGSGLGLTISRRLVELMGGELQVQSAPGRGSEFYFAASFGTSESTLPPVVAEDAKRVLVVDDHDLVRRNLVHIIESFGWSAVDAHSGQAALELLSEADAGTSPFDAYVLDWRMPGMDGVALASALRARKGNGREPVIIMVTSYERNLLDEQMPQGLVDAILTKPATSSSLFNALGEALGRREAPRKRGLDMKRLGGLRLLVVDDSEYNREVAQRILESEGATAELAENGQDAIDKLERDPSRFDLVLMDVQMPVMDGYQATRVIRASPEMSHLPVIALTAGAFRQQQDAAVASGMSGFVAKPFDVQQLIEAIQRLAPALSSSSRLDPTAEITASVPAITVHAADLSDTQVLDTYRGMEQWGEEAPYKRYLLRFLRDYHAPAALLRQLLHQGDRSPAISFVHKMRGATASLALLQLSRVAGQIEEALYGDNDVSELLDVLQDATSRAHAAIAAYADGIELDEPGDASGDWCATLSPAAVAALRELLQALDSDDPAQIETRLHGLRALVPAFVLEELHAQIDAFAFREAEAQVRQWLLQHHTPAAAPPGNGL